MTCNHISRAVGLIICIVWIAASAVIHWKLKHYAEYDVTGGYEIKNVKEEQSAGLDFFLTLILPLLINDITTQGGLFTFVALILIICVLLGKTDLYYQNPVLAAAGYRVYRFEFVGNSNFAKHQEIIGISFNTVAANNTIDYKVIDGNILLIRGRCRADD